MRCGWPGMSLESLREEVLRKARAKAEGLLRSAEAEARKILEEATREYAERVNAAREAELRELRDELSKKVSEESMKLNMELLEFKNKLVEDLIRDALERLALISEDVRRKSLRTLVRESIEEGPPEQVMRLMVVERDLPLVRDVVKELGIEGRVKEVGLLHPRYVGGVVVEFGNGSLSVDNTYLTRLERVTPYLYRRLRGEIFGG